MRVFGIIVAASLLGAMPARAGDIVVRIQGINNSSGEILVAACTEADFPAKPCTHVGRIAAKPGTVEVVLRNVPAGRWGLTAFHDVNGNLQLETDWLGRPREGVGFGNDAPISTFGPPSFEAASVAVPATGEVRTAFTIRYR